MSSKITREQFVRHEVFYYVHRCVDALNAGVDPPTVPKFLERVEALLPVIDEETRKYIAEAPGIEPKEREALLTEHCYRAVVLIAKLATLKAWGEAANRNALKTYVAYDYLAILRTYALMATIDAELAAMDQHIF